MLEAKKQGKIRFIGITNHRLAAAFDAVESGLYDTLQFPFSYLSGEKEAALVRLCAEKNIGFIAMKALSGGLITDIGAARNALSAYPNTVPIWGIQRESELDALLAAMASPPKLTSAQKKRVENDRRELSGEFCRGCGYCLPCPAGIVINMCARIMLMIRRSPEAGLVGETWQKEMAKIDHCQKCGACAKRCPYGLNPPALLEKNLREYRDYVKA